MSYIIYIASINVCYMPLPIAAIIAAGGNIIGQGINAASAGSINRKTMNFQREMYWRQREHALADWTAQNEYNSPAAQMQRLQAAGLNPNLIYGHGSNASNAGNVRSSSPSSVNLEVPRFDVGSVVGSYLDTQMKQAQIDNLKAQNTVITQEAIYKAAQIESAYAGIDRTRVSTERGRFDLDLVSELRQTSLEMASAQLSKIRSETTVMLDRNEREMLTNKMSLKEAAERILNYRQSRRESVQRVHNMREQNVGQIQSNMTEVVRRNLMSKDSELRQLDINLKKLGLQPTDELWQRVLGRLLSGRDINSILEEIREAP